MHAADSRILFAIRTVLPDMRTAVVAVGSFAVGCASTLLLRRILAAIDEPPTTAGQATADEPAASSAARDGFAECSPQDKPNWTRMAYEYQGIKKCAQVAGKRHLRFVLHADNSARPDGFDMRLQPLNGIWEPSSGSGDWPLSTKVPE